MRFPHLPESLVDERGFNARVLDHGEEVRKKAGTQAQGSTNDRPPHPEASQGRVREIALVDGQLLPSDLLVRHTFRKPLLLGHRNPLNPDDGNLILLAFRNQIHQHLQNMKFEL